MSDDHHQDGAEDSSTRSSALPNPLAGNVKLTLPGQHKPNDSAGRLRDRIPGPPQRRDRGIVDDRPDEEPADNGRAGQDADAEGINAGPDTTQGNADTETTDTDDSFDRHEDSAGHDRGLIKVLALGVCAVVAIIVIVWFSSRPPEKTDPPSGQQASLPTGGSRPPASPVKPVVENEDLPATFSADCAGQTDPKLAASTDPRSAWTCPTDGVPFGQKLVVTLPKPYVITGICFWPGFQGTGPDGRDAWFHYRLIQEASLLFNDIDRTVVPLAPRGVRSEFCLPLNRLIASAVELTVTASDAPPPEQKITPTSPPPGAPSTTGVPGVGELFPSQPDAGSTSENNPNATSIALWGFKLKGHAVS
ncbi:hypothetical protein BTO20_37825 (plasmid) [Mycobacterium dioxanotrophicus]|uniref:F5/8 type C domain-containing protein n=1 Tax=Mycobacterium dioxanotrophicus TaxID=482462 RepID=A0A1Y0CGJ3_9MYCO|nr:hypothetical protein BTO20_37825 [Mycobacterium dioxanotrophicus]